MIIECATCAARHTTACDDCIVSVLCGDDGTLEIDGAERAAIDAMSDAGLIAPIRLVMLDDNERASG